MLGVWLAATRLTLAGKTSKCLMLREARKRSSDIYDNICKQVPQTARQQPPRHQHEKPNLTQRPAVAHHSTSQHIIAHHSAAQHSRHTSESTKSVAVFCRPRSASTCAKSLVLCCGSQTQPQPQPQPQAHFSVSPQCPACPCPHRDKTRRTEKKLPYCSTTRFPELSLSLRTTRSAIRRTFSGNLCE
jgi:hypothetical protein